MKGKIYTVAEANRTLPLLRGIVADIKRVYGDINTTLEAYEKAKKEDAPAAVLNLKDQEVSVALEAFERLITEVENLGAYVKDYEHGYIDFYGEIGGEIVYLCWAGESEIRYWHRLEESFGKRLAIGAVNPLQKNKP
jgi:hypothetical protein